MRIGVLRITTIFLIFIYMSPSQACQPERIVYKNYAVDLEDGEHVLAMNYNRDSAFEYPVSGVYRKGADKQLVWEITEKIAKFFVPDHLSANGRFFVHTFFHRTDGPGFPDAVVSIYDYGNLMHEFYWDTFTEDRSFDEGKPRQFLLVCPPYLWAKMQYDKQLDRIRVESFGERVVTIHVPTAQILHVEYDSNEN